MKSIWSLFDKVNTLFYNTFIIFQTEGKGKIMYYCTLFSHAKVRREQFLLHRGTHPRWALFLMEEGEFRCQMNHKSELIREGDYMIFPPNMNFERQVILPITFHYFQFHAQFPEHYFPCGKLSPCDTGRTEQIRNLLNQLPAIELPTVTNLKQHLLNDMVLQYFVHANSVSFPNATPNMDNDIQYLLEYLNQHFAEKINIQDLSAQLGMTHAGLIAKFKRFLGVPPVIYLLQLRIEHAKRLLINTPLSLSEIAPLCGYENIYYFSNSFKKAVGYAPSVYRKEMQI